LACLLGQSIEQVNNILDTKNHTPWSMI